MSLVQKYACPNCKGTNIQVMSLYTNDKNLHRATCNDCYMTAPAAKSAAEAVMAWNRLALRIGAGEWSESIDLPGGGPLNIHICIQSSA